MNTIKLQNNFVKKLFEKLQKTGWQYGCKYYEIDRQFHPTKREVFIRRITNKLFNQLKNRIVAVGYENTESFCEVQTGQSYYTLNDVTRFSIIDLSQSQLFVTVSNVLNGGFILKLSGLDCLQNSRFEYVITETTLSQMTFYDLTSELETFSNIRHINKFLMNNLNVDHHYDLKLSKAFSQLYFERSENENNWNDSTTEKLKTDWQTIQHNQTEVDNLYKKFCDRTKSGKNFNNFLNNSI